jgi:small GTP-binding protein
MEEIKNLGTYKIVLLGNANVGKSCIVYRFAKGEFLSESQPTIGANFVTRKVQLDSQSYLKFDIWDTAGQERYKSLTPMYYKGAAAALIVYDVSNAVSFEGAKDWIKELQNHANPNILIGLAANKCDLVKEVDRESGAELASRHHLLFYEISAKTGEKVEDLFYEIAKKIPKSPFQRSEIEATRLYLNTQQNKEDSGCCF